MRIKPARLMVLAGIAYGFVLTVIGVMLAGAGHGTYLLLGIASAPFGGVSIIFAIALPPLIWGAIANLLAQRRQLLLVALAIHYFSVPLIFFTEDFGERKYIASALDNSPGLLLSGFAIYAIGQILIWFYWFKSKTIT